MHLKETIFSILIFLLISFHMIVFEQGMGGDGWGYYAVTESIIKDKDLNLDNNIYGVYNGFTKDPKTGRWITQYPPGTSLMDIPFFFCVTKISQKFNLRFPAPALPESAGAKNIPDSIMPGIIGIIAAHNFYTLLGLLFVYFTLRINGFSSLASSLIVFAGYLASPLHFYGQSGMSHANSFCVLSTIVWLYARLVRSHNISLWFFIGLLCALATSVRLPNALMIIISFFSILYMSIDKKIRSIFLLGAGFMCLIPVIPLFYILHSNHISSSYSGSFFFDRPPLINILFSPHRGFMIFHPLFLLVIPGVIYYLSSKKFSSDSRIVMLFALFSAFSISAIYGYFGEWWGSGSYSQRYLTDFTGMFIVCMASVYKSQKPLNIAVIIFTVTAVLFSYCLFIISISQVIEFPNNEIWARYITDFKYFFQQGITPKQIILGLKDHVYGIKGIISLFNYL